MALAGCSPPSTAAFPVMRWEGNVRVRAVSRVLERSRIIGGAVQLEGSCLELENESEKGNEGHSDSSSTSG